METENESKLVEVFAGQLWQATTIKNLLEDFEIQAFLENERMGIIAPWRLGAGGFNPVKVWVSSLDEAQALKLIDEFNNSEPVYKMKDDE